MEVVEGQILAGKYRIERVLGRGGMGLVVAAMHLQLGELVALKFLLPEAISNPEALARFDREARAAVRIKSEHVARVSDVGVLDNGAPYMVMEYLQGLDLSVWLAQRGVLPPEQAVEFVLQACEAIAEAHALGIVHRDLKPANLFVIERPDGGLSVKVLDFGISKTTGPSSYGAAMTRTSAVLGSPLYMAPEQMQSAKDVDSRADIWALGVLLYELVSGRTPFPGETMAELVLKVVTAPPVALRAVCAHVPAGLEAAVHKCLQKDRAARFPTVAELAAALFEFAPRQSKYSVERIGRVQQRAGMSLTTTQLPHLPVPSRSSIPDRHTMASWGKTNPPPNQRRRRLLIALGLIAVPAVAVGAFSLARWRAHSAALAESAVPLSAAAVAPRTAEALAIAQPVPVVKPAASFVVESSPSASSAISAANLARLEGAPPASSVRSALPAQGKGSQLPKPRASATSAVASAAPLPTPATVTSKPTPKNPLQMTIQ